MGERIVLQLVNCCVGDMRAPLADDERITVRCSPGDPAHTDAAGSTCDVLNKDGLT